MISQEKETILLNLQEAVNPGESPPGLGETQSGEDIIITHPTSRSQHHPPDIITHPTSRSQRSPPLREEGRVGGGGMLHLDAISAECDSIIREAGLERGGKKTEASVEGNSGAALKGEAEKSQQQHKIAKDEPRTSSDGVDTHNNNTVTKETITRSESETETQSADTGEKRRKLVVPTPPTRLPGDGGNTPAEAAGVGQESSAAKENGSLDNAEVKMWVSKSVKVLLEHLNRYGVCVVDNFLGDEKGGKVLDEIWRMQKHNYFKDGQVMSGGGQNEPAIRSDKITWTDGYSPLNCPNLRFLVQLLDSIVLTANKVKNNGDLGKYRLRGRTRIMVACYPGGGTRYVKHVDNPNRDGRVVTAIYYLNRNWNSKTDGGSLKIYSQINKGKVIQVDPVFDRVVFFWSDSRNPHEVLPANKPRYAVTVWYLDEKEKEEYNRRLRADEFMRTQAQRELLRKPGEDDEDEDDGLSEVYSDRTGRDQPSSTVAAGSGHQAATAVFPPPSFVRRGKPPPPSSDGVGGAREPQTSRIKHTEDRLLSDYS